MIKRVCISNFGSLFDVDVKLGPFTLLLGPNASGKSMFIRGLRVLAKLLRGPIRGPKGDFALDHARLDDLVSCGDPSRTIKFSVWLEDADARPNYVLEIGKVEGLWTVVHEDICWNGFIFSSSDGDFGFPTERRGKIMWETPGSPPRHATLPYLVYPYREDRMAAHLVKPLIDLQVE